MVSCLESGCEVNENRYKPRHYRIVRHVTKSRILDVQDLLDINKLRIEVVEYAEGEGATRSAEHFAEPDALALVLYDILNGRPWERYVEYKGSQQGETVISRVLTIERVEARNPIKITVSRGPGKVVEKGAIQPLGKPETSVSVLLSELDARRIAYTLLRHLAAYEAATYHARVAASTWRGEADSAPQSEETPDPPAPSVEPVAIAEAAQAQSPVAAPVPRRRPAPAVETYWAAAERLAVGREEAERILAAVNGDWARAWQELRRRGEQLLRAN